MIIATALGYLIGVVLVGTALVVVCLLCRMLVDLLLVAAHAVHNLRPTGTGRHHSRKAT